MSNLRTEQPVFETDRITDGFDIFFWVFNDASSFVATHWHTAIEIMYIIDGEVDVMMNQQTVILKPGDVFLIDSRLPHSTKSVHGNHAVLIQLPYEFSKKYIPDVDSFIFGFDCHTDNAILRTCFRIHKKALQYTDHPFRDFADRMFSGRIFLSLFQKKYGSDLFPILK